jgi:hypothetical protein
MEHSITYLEYQHMEETFDLCTEGWIHLCQDLGKEEIHSLKTTFQIRFGLLQKGYWSIIDAPSAL